MDLDWAKFLLGLGALIVTVYQVIRPWRYQIDKELDERKQGRQRHSAMYINPFLLAKNCKADSTTFR